MSVDLSGDVAVVTGAAGRLGRLWCRTLASAGARVVGLDLVPGNGGGDSAGGDSVGGRDSAGGGSGGEDEPRGPVDLWLHADVTDRESIRAALERTLAAYGVPTILVNNAGIDSPPSSRSGSWRFEDIPDEVSASVLDVNALGVLRMCQSFGAHMVRAGRGSVVNIGSVYAGVAPDPRLYEHIPMDPPFLKPPSYGMSKAGVVALSRYLAALWGPHGIRVNTLSPGGVLADQDETFRKGYSAKVPLGRMARLEDLAGPLLFLASGMSAYVTGHELVVDGGLVIW